MEFEGPGESRELIEYDGFFLFFLWLVDEGKSDDAALTVGDF